MKVMRFTAPDMAGAIRELRQALGPDAVILSTGRLPGGGVEISAAVDDAPPKQTAASRMPRAAEAPAEQPGQAAVSALARRVESLGRDLKRHLVMAEAATGFSARPEVAPYYGYLSRQEVSPEIIGQLMQGLLSADGRGLLPRLGIRLKKLLRAAGPPKVQKGLPAAWALVGPTGSGKTTTVAKLAAAFCLRQGLSVGMITVDTFRIAATEQLLAYGRIMEVPTLVASTPAEMQKAMAEFARVDLILVDTVGRAHDDNESLEELKEILLAAKGLESHLVLACPTRDRDQAMVAESFSRFDPKTLIFTKLDETTTYGPILNRIRQTGLAVSYLATGQRVPDDLEQATREGLAKRLMPSRRDLEAALP